MTHAMTQVTASPSILTRIQSQDPLFTAASLFLFLSLIPTLAAAQIDARLFQGENIWLKPIKFQIALGLYLATLAYFSQWLPATLRSSRRLRLFQILVLICILGEMLWIAGAAFLGTASHFNLNTPLSGALYGLMGLFAVTLTSASLVWGIAIARNRATGLPPALHQGIALGLILTLPLTVIVAGTMSSLPGHLVGTPITGKELWLMGWSREVGDLRAPHFLATHALHAIPVAAIVAHFTVSPRLAARLTWAAAAAYTALTLWSFATALRGLPLI